MIILKAYKKQNDVLLTEGGFSVIGVRGIEPGGFDTALATFEQVFDDNDMQDAEEEHERLVENGWDVIHWIHMANISPDVYYLRAGFKV